MKHLLRTVLLALVCWVSAPADAEALCPNESWNQSSGAIMFRTGATELFLRGMANVSHDATNHTSSCSGTIFIQPMYLSNAAGYTCTHSGSLAVTHTSSHSFTLEKTCSNLTRGFYYTNQMEFWWSGDPHEFLDSEEVYIPKDADSDGHDEFEDCNDDRNDVWDDCTDADTDMAYAFEDCDDNNDEVQEEVECQQWECEVVLQLHWGPPCSTPILIAEDPLTSLTHADRGVVFDILATGRPQLVAWTRPGSNAGWLALDRNANGRIDNGSELFGNVTPQPDHPIKNGFLALATFDDNGDGWIDKGDQIFAHLRLWKDTNHDGLSQPDELHPLAIVNVERLSLDYKVTRKADGHGNQFTYRTRVVSRGVLDHFAWDVTLQTRWITTQTPRPQQEK